MTIGERIKYLRMEKGWTLRRLGYEMRNEDRPMGYSSQAILDWEKGAYAPSERAIRSLEKALGTKLRK